MHRNMNVKSEFELQQRATPLVLGFSDILLGIFVCNRCHSVNTTLKGRFKCT